VQIISESFFHRKKTTFDGTDEVKSFFSEKKKKTYFDGADVFVVFLMVNL
jgi:hypothetical protein